MRWLRGLFAGLLVVSMVGQAMAATGPFNRDWGNDYFTNNTAAILGWVFLPTGVTPYGGITADWNDPVAGAMTLAKFIQAVEVRLNDNTSLLNRGRAAAFIDVMLGKDGTDFGGSIANGIAYAQSHQTEWEDLVTFYDTNTITNAVPGYWVEWNTVTDFTGTTITGVGDQTGGQAVALPDIVFKNDVPDNSIDKTIVFHAPSQLLRSIQT